MLADMAQNQPMKTKKLFSRKLPDKCNSYTDGVEFLKVADESNLADDTDDELDVRKMLGKQKNLKKKKSGGFQSMGFTSAVYKGVMKKGYKVPTPIQRKTIPLIMDGKDVVAMARTGSGKTAAFLLPMLERLKSHSAKVGARALILSPTRELALQTMRFTKELGRFTTMKTAVILGGDKLDNQFAAMHENPDIIVATPGRLLHIIMEMDLKLSSVEYVVFDEADRLFEMGFAEQLHEIIRRLPEFRQTLLFSATLPKLLVDFAKAGLTDPVLVRLDVDTKLSDQLKLAFFTVRADDKAAALLYILQEMVNSNEQTLVFVATRHHLEYIKEFLLAVGIECSYVYSTLDQAARKINVGKFVHKKTMVMVVTDVAARGIDIPMLDNVVNYNFPAKAKLFIHRVGRVGRAGRSGTAYSLVSSDELAHMLDLHLFLGRPLRLAMDSISSEESDGVVGSFPQTILDDQESIVRTVAESSHDMMSLKRVADNAYKQYLKSRTLPSKESVKRTKEFHFPGLPVHPFLRKEVEGDSGIRRGELLDGVRNFRPRQTIFEVHSKGNTPCQSVMKNKRLKHSLVIERNRQRKEPPTSNQETNSNMVGNTDTRNVKVIVDDNSSGKKTKNYSCQDVSSGFRDENYIPHWSSDHFEESALGLSTFEKDVAVEVSEIIPDENEGFKKSKNSKKWDRKRKKFIGTEGQKSKKIKTESGARIPASYKTNQYKEWVKRTRLDMSTKMEEEKELSNKGSLRRKSVNKGMGGKFSKRKGGNQVHGRKELKAKEQILKERHKKKKLQQMQKKGKQKNKRKLSSTTKRKRQFSA